MPAARTCRFLPLGKQPLVLVLAQVRISPVRTISAFIPEIQEAFRQSGFPIERAGKIQQLTITPTGVQATEQDRWEYRTRDERWSVTVLHDSVVLQTTAYTRFEAFAEKLGLALRNVLSKTRQDELGVVQRIGLRYVDIVLPGEGESFRRYLRPGLHGIPDEVFQPGTHRVHLESVGRTKVGAHAGTMVVRISQNDLGFDLPPDLVESAPLFAPRSEKGKQATLIDMDHFMEGTFDANADWVIHRSFELHDLLIETFHQHVVSEQAIEAWR